MTGMVERDLITEGCLPCPCCGSDDLDSDVSGDHYASVFCADCGVGTLKFECCDEMRRVWNRRAALSPQV